MLQRVTRASVTVEGQVRARSAGADGPRGRGSRRYAGHRRRASPPRPATCASSGTSAGLTNRSLIDTGGAVLAISQFTLYADTRKAGRRSSTRRRRTSGKALYERFAVAVEARGVRVERGVFGVEMQVELVNDGPMTIQLDSAA
ncbi:MAG: D-aminoacyl-tRNA deacylase [Chloroflexota bacterium]